MSQRHRHMHIHMHMHMQIHSHIHIHFQKPIRKHRHIHFNVYIHVRVQIHVRVRVCLCFMLCGAVSCRVPRVVGWLGGWVWWVVWCDVLLSTCRCRGRSCPWSFLLRMMSILQRARAERSMIERRVRQCMECVVLAPFPKWVRIFGEPLNHVITLRGQILVGRKLAIRDELNIP